MVVFKFVQRFFAMVIGISKFFYCKSAPNINTILTDDCLGHVFQWLSLKELVKIRAVCHRWETVQNEVRRRRKTVFLDGLRTNGPCTNPVRLFFSELNTRNCIRLLNEFPNIDTVAIRKINCVDTKALANLFLNWRQLKSIELNHFTITHWESVFKVFNSLPQIRSLKLQDMELFDYEDFNKCDLTVVYRQLDHFTIDESMSEEIFDLINRFSLDKQRKLFFNISKHKYNVEPGDEAMMKQVRNQFDCVVSIYQLFEDMIPTKHQNVLPSPRGILRDIPMTFSFDVVQ